MKAWNKEIRAVGLHWNEHSRQFGILPEDLSNGKEYVLREKNRDQEKTIEIKKYKQNKTDKKKFWKRKIIKKKKKKKENDGI